MSAQQALDKYYRKILAENVGSKRTKNGQPEKNLEKEVFIWLAAHGFSLHTVESKAVFSKRLGRYLKSQAVAGFSDLVGVSPTGLGCFIELKAPGRLSTLRPAQRAFLAQKIECGAFAVVVDSVDRLATLWEEFQLLRGVGFEEGVAYLLAKLPIRRRMGSALWGKND